MNTNINFPIAEFLDPLTKRPSLPWLLWLQSPSVISVNLNNALGVSSGGTGLSTIPTNGQLLIGNGTGYSLNTLTAGTAIGITNSAGAITITNNGVTSLTASTGIGLSSSTGAITISNTGVTSFQTSLSGLTPNTSTTGSVTLAGTLGVASGGTGAITLIGYVKGNGTSAFTASTTVPTTDLSGTITNAQLANSTISGVALGGNLFNLTAGTGVSFSSGTTYNGSTAITINATGTGGTVTSVSGTAPISVATGTTTPVISISQATTSTNGYLSSTDWNTFNNKQPAGTYVNSVSGTTGRITSTGGVTPIIDLASGIATAGTTGSSTLIPVITIDTYGRVTTITTASNPQGTVTSVAATVPSFLSITGSPITSSGTLAISYSGTALPSANGGTSQTTYTTGDLLYASATNTLSKLAVGTNGYGLVVASGVPTWKPPYVRTSFTATAGQTTFTATYNVGYVQVFLNGVLLNGADYTATNGTSVVLAVAANLNDIVETIAYHV